MTLYILLDALIPVAVDSANYVVEVIEPSFCDMPKYIWDGIFAVVDVLVVGLLLAYIATKYQHRKEVEWKLRGELLEKRIESYHKVSKFIYALYNQQDPTEKELESISSLLEYPQLVIPSIKYAEFYSSEKSFQDFRLQLDNLITQEKLFLDYPVLLHLECMRFYFDEVAGALDNFISKERNPKKKFTATQIAKHIDIGMKAFGVALNNDMSKWYAWTDQLIAEKMRKPEMVPGKYRFEHWWDDWTDSLIEWAQKKKKRSRFIKFFIWLKIGRWDFFQSGSMMYLVLLGAHYMDLKVPIWEETPENAHKLITEYYQIGEDNA